MEVFDIENSYWNSKGKFQKEYDFLYSSKTYHRIADDNYDVFNDFEKLVHTLCVLSTIYHDHYNNGCGNLTDREEEITEEYYGPWIEEIYTLSDWGVELLDHLKYNGFNNIALDLKNAMIDWYYDDTVIERRLEHYINIVLEEIIKCDEYTKLI